MITTASAQSSQNHLPSEFCTYKIITKRDTVNLYQNVLERPNTKHAKFQNKTGEHRSAAQMYWVTMKELILMHQQVFTAK